MQASVDLRTHLAGEQIQARPFDGGPHHRLPAVGALHAVVLQHRDGACGGLRDDDDEAMAVVVGRAAEGRHGSHGGSA